MVVTVQPFLVFLYIFIFKFAFLSNLEAKSTHNIVDKDRIAYQKKEKSITRLNYERYGLVYSHIKYP